MLRILIMSLLGLSGIFLETFCADISSASVTPSAEMTSGIDKAEEITSKSKRHGVYPCPQSHQSYGSYIPQAAYFSGHHQAQVYQKPIVIPSYQQFVPKVDTIGYQKPVVEKMVYQVIQKPQINHAAFNVQPVLKQQVQYIQQPIYSPIVKKQPISYVKSVTPSVSYNNIQKLITGYAKPVQYIQPVQTIQPLKTYANKISYNLGSSVLPEPVKKPSIHFQSYYPTKQYFQPISHYSKPSLSQSMPIYYSSGNYMNKYSDYSRTEVIYQKANPISVKQPITDCEKPKQPQISYVKIPQPVIQQIHQPIVQYAAKYQQPMIHYVQKSHQPIFQQPIYHYQPKVQQPVINFVQKIHQPIVQQPIVNIQEKIHQPIAQNFVVKYAQPMITYGHAAAQHSVPIVAPRIDHGVNYQSHIVGVNQPCHK